jgi:hypothetical protein
MRAVIKGRVASRRQRAAKRAEAVRLAFEIMSVLRGEQAAKARSRLGGQDGSDEARVNAGEATEGMAGEAAIPGRRWMERLSTCSLSAYICRRATRQKVP